jgi:hypothetical protein
VSGSSGPAPTPQVRDETEDCTTGADPPSWSSLRIKLGLEVAIFHDMGGGGRRAGSSTAAGRSENKRLRAAIEKERSEKESALGKLRNVETELRRLKRKPLGQIVISASEIGGVADPPAGAAAAAKILRQLNPGAKADRPSADKGDVPIRRLKQQLEQETSRAIEATARCKSVELECTEAKVKLEQADVTIAGLVHQVQHVSRKSSTTAASLKKTKAELRTVKSDMIAAQEVVKHTEAQEKEHAEQIAALEDEHAERVASIEAECDAREKELKKMQQALQDFKQSSAKALVEFKTTVGVAPKSLVPKPTERKDRTGIDHAESCRRVRENSYLKAALSDRDPWALSYNLKAAGGEELLHALVDTPEFGPVVHRLIKEAGDRIQTVWNARHSVHVMSDLSLSRELFELLRRLLSYVYVPPAVERVDGAAQQERGDFYLRRQMWVNRFNERQAVPFPELQPRKPRETEQAKLLGPCALEQSIDGLSAGRQDLVGSVAGLVGHYWSSGALLKSVTEGEEKLLLLGYGDATGGWRAAAVSHFETGIGSWQNGRSASKVTLMPSHLYEGDDHAPNLRARAKQVFDGWQTIINDGKIRFFPKTSADIQIAKEKTTAFRFSGDFQIIKSINNMSLYTSAIWCECSGTKLNQWPGEPLPSWAAALLWLDKAKCVIKSLQRICALNGWSYELLIGKEFKKFDCGMSECKHEHCWTTEASWRAWVAKVQAMDHDEYKEFAREWGGAHSRHYPGFAPMLFDKSLGMLVFSADILHLIFINYFKMHLEVLIFVYLMELSPEAREPIEVFLHSKSIPIRLAKSITLTEVSQSLTGRDAKVMCEKANEIFPELLEWAHAPQEAIEAAAKAAADERRNGGGKTAAATPEKHDNVFTMRRPSAADSDDDDSEDEDEDGATAEKEAEEAEARKLQYAGFLDDFSALVYAVRPFERDDKAFREERALELFNAGSKCGRNMVSVRENFDSAVPHVLTSVVTRQMVLDGDPNRRATDQSEAIGVTIKFDLHNRCNRQRLKRDPSKAKRRNSKGEIVKEWKQKLTISRIMQVFKKSVLREALRRDPDSAKYLQRKDFVTKSTGFVTGDRKVGVVSRLSGVDRTAVKKLMLTKQETGEAP